MTPETLKKMRERCEAATEGLWDVVYAHGWALGVGVDMSKPGTVLRVFEMVGNTLRKNTPDTRAAQNKLHHNAQFIAAAHQDLPACLDEIERLRGILLDIADDEPTEGFNPIETLCNKIQNEARKALEATQ